MNSRRGIRLQMIQRWLCARFNNSNLVTDKSVMCRKYNRRMTDFRFFHPVEVRYGDLDPQGHVNNAKYLTFFEQARVQYMINLGLYAPDQSFMKVGVIVVDAHIAFLAPIHFGDDVKVGVRISKLGNKSMTAEQNIVNYDSGKEMAKG